MGYEWIYKLPVNRIAKGEKDWYKLKWRPIKNGTYNLYITDTHHSWRTKLIGVRFSDASAHNGWGRSWDGIGFEFGFYFLILNFWIRWNIIVHKDGAMDVAEEDKRSLLITGD